MIPDYSRETLLEWARNHAPDLRVARAVIAGQRVFFARFTHQGAEHEVESDGEKPDEEIVLKVVEALRSLLNLPPLFEPNRDTELEQSIVRASLEGDTEQAERLTRQLVMGRQPRAVRATTRFDTREIW